MRTIICETAVLGQGIFYTVKLKEQLCKIIHISHRIALNLSTSLYLYNAFVGELLSFQKAAPTVPHFKTSSEKSMFKTQLDNIA